MLRSASDRMAKGGPLTEGCVLGGCWDEVCRVGEVLGEGGELCTCIFHQIPIKEVTAKNVLMLSIEIFQKVL